MQGESLLIFIIVGLIAGWLASQVIPSGFGLVGDTVCGMVGALIGGVLFEALGESGGGGFTIWSIFVAFVGAVILLLILREVRRRRV